MHSVQTAPSVPTPSGNESPLSLLIIVIYILLREVIGPMVKWLTTKLHESDGNSRPADKVQALEVNLSTLDTKVVDLETSLTENATALDNKLDLLLEEIKDAREKLGERLSRIENGMTERLAAVGERLAKAETHLYHMLYPDPNKPPGRKDRTPGV